MHADRLTADHVSNKKISPVTHEKCNTNACFNHLKDWNISKEIALDRSAWRLAINVPEP